MSRTLRTPDYVAPMPEAIRRIRNYTAPLTSETFESSPMTVDAVVRNLEIIGEAARNVLRDDPAFAAVHPEIPWEAMYAMRNRVSHGYFSVDTSVVWMTVQRDLPSLQKDLEKLPTDRQ